VLASPCYIIGDTHLGVGPPDLERRLVAFLRHVPTQAKSLIINGDLFDFWFEWRTVIPRDHFRTLAALADLRDAGIDILMVAGNHDCWGGEILRRDVGVTYHVGRWAGRIAGWNAVVDHGDGLRPVEDRRYRALRRVLRNRVAIGAMRLLHPDLGTWLATRSSDASRTHRARDGGAGLRAIAAQQLTRADAPELLVFGHSHVATLERAGAGVYANAGSWLEAPTFLRVTPERVELRRWTGSAEGDRLDAVDRGAEKALA
jgi:UDP-2,3-diacylglucosamine hydrolase